MTYPDHMFPTRCLPPGSYRVELYHEGRLVGEDRGRSTQRSLVGFQDRDTGVVGCRPRRWTASRLDASGLIRGYASDDRKSGLYVARLNNVVAPGASTRRPGTHAIARLLGGLAPVFGPELRFVDVQRFDFMELNTRTQIIGHYRYGGRHLLVGAGQDTDGSILAALAFGTPKEYREGRLKEMLAALALGYDQASISAAPATSDPARLASQEIE
jgi:hypothetical protein